MPIFYDKFDAFYTYTVIYRFRIKNWVILSREKIKNQPGDITKNVVKLFVQELIKLIPMK